MKLVQIVDADYYAKANPLLEVEDHVVIEEEKFIYEKWYQEIYCKQMRDGLKPKYFCFHEWLVYMGIAKEADREVFYG